MVLVLRANWLNIDEGSPFTTTNSTTDTILYLGNCHYLQVDYLNYGRIIFFLIHFTHIIWHKNYPKNIPIFRTLDAHRCKTLQFDLNFFLNELKLSYILIIHNNQQHFSPVRPFIKCILVVAKKYQFVAHAPPVISKLSY